MTTTIDYALLAGAAYYDTRAGINRFPVPQGWYYVSLIPSQSSGFEAATFTNGNEIVISYAGTYEKDILGDIGADLALAAGNLTAQFIQAAEYYLAVKNDPANAGKNITFTGHSLGGGLAALMSVFFDENAFTFDQAPFLNAATRTPGTDLDGNPVPSTAESLRAVLASKGWGDKLKSLDDYIAATDPANTNPNPVDTLVARGTNVMNINVEGEFLTSWFLVPSSNRIGSQLGDIANSNNIGFLDGLDLHSQALLTAFLQSGDTVNSTPENHTLGQVSKKLTDLLKMIFDKNLYAYDTDKPDENFLERLVRHQNGITGSSVTGEPPITADAMLTRFTSDLWKLAQNGGMALKDGNSSSNWVSRALTAFAMQKYYEEKQTSAGYKKELFTDIFDEGAGSGGIHFDMADVSDKFATALVNNEKLTLTDAKGFDLYLKYFFDNNLDFGDNFTVAEDQLILSLLPYLRDWYIQAGASGMNATDALNRAAFMLGGTQADALIGGTGADLLVGNAGDDLLQGGLGNDFLLGGKGNDAYVYTTGDGLDTILDSDGKGSIAMDGAILAGGDQYGDTHVHRDANKHLYVDVGNGRMVIDGNILIEGYQMGQLGLSMTGAPAEIANPAIPDVPQTDRTINGDLKNEEFKTVLPNDGTLPDPSWFVISQQPTTPQNILDGNGNVIGVENLDIEYTYNKKDDLGNWLVSGSEPDKADTLFGSGGNDHISGGGGNDTIYATQGGNDYIELGEGFNFVNAGSGNDYILGGSEYDGINAGDGDNYIAAGDGVNNITSGTSNDYIITGNGRDTIRAGDGDNYIEAGAENDMVHTGNGKDIIIGGAGSDVLDGGGEDDRLYADKLVDVATAIAQGNAQSGSGTTGDWLNGRGGDDTLIGSNGNDELFGGGGSDLIVAGAGDDHICGDQNLTSTETTWASQPTEISNPSGGAPLVVGYNWIWVEPSTYPADGAADVIYAGTGNDVVLAQEGNDVVFGEKGNDTLIGGSGNDTLLGGDDNDVLWGDNTSIHTDMPTGDDYLDGGSGNDILFGESGDDILLGDKGTDILYGGAGRDTYIFNQGDGIDTIFDSSDNKKSNTNILRFGEGISASSVTLHLGSLVLDLGNGDQIHINNEDQAGANGFDRNDVFNSSCISSFEFADGTTLSTAELLERGFDLDGTEGDDIILGTNITDRLNGLGGNDMLEGGAGDDILTGGRGDDILTGGTGSDNYVFNRGDGQDIIIDAGDVTDTDTLQFAVDILQSDMNVRRTPAGELEFTLINSNDKITIAGWYTADANANRIERIVFGDGSILTIADFENLPISGTEGDDIIDGTSAADTILGLGGNDTINSGQGDDSIDGGTGDDVLDGGAGNDTLIGGGGQDTLVMSYGMGVDTLIDTSATGGTLQLKGSLTASDLTFVQQDNDLFVQIGAGSNTSVNEGLLIKDYYSNPQAVWSILDASGTPTTVQSQIDSVANKTEIEQAESAFIANAKNNLIGGYIAQGYALQNDGSYYLQQLVLPYGASNQITAYNTVSDVTTVVTQHFTNTGGTIQSTTGYSMQTWDALYERLYSPVVQENSVTINVVNTTTDASVIYADRDVIQDGYGTKWLQMSWTSTPSSTWTNTPNISYTYIYDLGMSSSQYATDLGMLSGYQETIIYQTNTVYSMTGTVKNIISEPGDMQINGSSPQAVEVWGTSTQMSREIQAITLGDAGQTVYANAQTMVHGGNGNDSIYDAGFANGGGGDDVIDGATTQYGGDGNDSLSNGDYLNGGTGDDVLTMGSVLTGGAGNDTMDGGNYGTGNTRYVIDPTQTGIDLIGDTGDSEGAYNDWYYAQLGLSDVALHGGMEGYYTSRSIASDTGYFTAEELADPNNWLAGWFASHPGDLLYIEPLPPVDRPAAYDYAALQAAYDAGVIPMDTIEFTAGVALADMTLTWGREAGRSTLDMSWNNGASQVRLVMPNADDPLGFGIEQVKFADGSVFSMRELLTHAPFYNHAPTVIQPLTDQGAVAGEAFSFSLQGDVPVNAPRLSDASDTGTSDREWGYQIDTSLYSSGGNDIYNFGRGSGSVFVGEWDSSPLDRIQLGADIAPSDIKVDFNGRDLLLFINGTTDRLIVSNFVGVADPYRVEQLVFADGTVWSSSDIESMISASPSTGNDRIAGTAGNDVILALSGDDEVHGGEGNDTVLGGAGYDVLYGGAGNDILDGGSGDDSLFGDSGSNLLRGGDGADYLASDDDENYYDSSNDMLDGGAGDDYLDSSIANDLLIGGMGNDWISANDGNDVILFNRGDGSDWYSPWSVGGLPLSQRTNTVSLGGGIGFDDLSFEIGFDEDDDPFLILNLGSGDSLSFANWFDTSLQDSKSINTLQIISEAMAEYNATSTDPLLNKRIQQFDFLGLANEFEAALAADPSITTWQIAPHLTDFYLGGSDTSALGGDMAYLYGVKGNLDILTDAEISTRLNDAAFGITNQELSKAALGGAEVFNDIDIIGGDALTYSATLADGTALPSWLTFDAATQTFSGTPANGDAGVLQVAVVATDTGGLSATTVFNLDVVSLNTAPVVTGEIIDQTAMQSALFSFVVPAATFTDTDSGDVLSYRATLVDGADLPEWLSFDAETLTFQGTPAASDITSLSILLIATDLGGLSVSNSFNLLINASDQPTIIYWSNPDGSYGSDTNNPDGSHQSYSVDATGTATDSYYNTAGQLTAAYWSNPNGSSGSATYNADGSHQSYSIDVTGTATDSYYNTAGQLTVAYWSNPNGSSGSSIYNPDGSHQSYSVDVSGTATDSYYNTAGQLTVAYWSNPNGSSGSSTYHADGSYKAYSYDTAGTSKDAYYNSLGQLLNDYWVGENGMEGGDTYTYNQDGSYLQQWFKNDGSYGTFSVNDAGVTVGGSVFNADGSQNITAASNHLVIGRYASDILITESGNDIVIGGGGNDTFITGSGADIIAFNSGDGQDTVVASTSLDNTISLGGGIQYANLAMSKAGNDLIFSTGNGDQITLQNWYASTANHSVKNLQVVLDNAAYNAGSADSLLNHQVQIFDFNALANGFDQALAATPTLTSWSLSDALLTAHLAGRDTAALGGDLAYQYNLNNTLAGIGLASAQTVMNDANFGTAPQTLKPLNELQQGVVSLG